MTSEIKLYHIKTNKNQFSKIKPRVTNQKKHKQKS